MKKENETLTLISKNEDQANAAIENWKTRATEATTIIQEFNNINLLNPITTQEQALKFLQDPAAYFDNALQSDLEFSCKAQPIPKAIAGLFGIDYIGVVNKIGVCKLRDLTYMVWDEKTQAIEFDKSCTDKIMKAFYEYAQDQKESEAITKAREVCKVLNKYCKETAGIANDDIHAVANGLNLKCEIIPGSVSRDPGIHYTFIENVAFIRDQLAYNKNMEEIEKGMEGVR